MRTGLRLLASMLPFALGFASAQDFAPSVAPIPDALRANVLCSMSVIALETGVPTADEVGLPAFPDAVFGGRFAATDAAASGVGYTMLANVFLLTPASVEDVAAFYAAQLDPTWSRADQFGTVIFYQHEPVDDVMNLLMQQPGALPVVEIAGIVDADCDRLVLPEAQTFVRIYYPQN